MNIRRATHSDLEQVHLIANEHILTNIGDHAKNGFLVSSYSLKDYETLLHKAEYFYVAERNRKATAFVIAYTKNLISPDFPIETVESYAGDNFIVIKQICVRNAESRQGTGSLLYRYLIDKTHPAPLLAAIVLQPRNVASIDFHAKHGFHQLFTFTPNDGLLRGMWGTRIQ